MPWKCPACSSEIVHREVEYVPRTGVVYRCPVCRLELQFDPATNRMRPAPLPPDDTGDHRKQRRGTA